LKNRSSSSQERIVPELQDGNDLPRKCHKAGGEH
jgi:hypothetical protein